MDRKSTYLSWKQMSIIQIGGAICLPVLMVGQAIGQAYGISQAFISIIIGNMLLLGLGLIKARMAFENKKITVENAVDYFGKHGAKLLALNMIITLMAWFALQLNVISLSMIEVLKIIGFHINDVFAFNVSLGVLMTLGAVAGMQALHKLAKISMPVLVCVMIYSLVQALKYPHTLQPIIAESGNGISLVLSTALLAIIDIPTYYRFSRSAKDSFLSIFATFGVALPLIEMTGVIIAHSNKGDSIVTTLIAQGGFQYQLLILAFLVLAGWTTNNGNIYSAAVTLEDVTGLSVARATIIIGSIGTILSCFDLLKHFEKTLSAMTICTSAMGAVIAVGYILKLLRSNRNQNIYVNLIAFLLGVITGFLSLFEAINLTGIPVLDAFCVAALSCCLAFLFLGKK